MKPIKPVHFAFVLALVSSCGPPKHAEQPLSTRLTNAAATNEFTQETGLALLSRIQENMTFDQIAKMIPLSTNLRAYAGEHGGVWYDVPIGSNYFIQLSFEHPLGKKNPNGKKSIDECLLNQPPVLQQKTDKAIVDIATNGIPR